jgi:hypothetical protein
VLPRRRRSIAEIFTILGSYLPVSFVGERFFLKKETILKFVCLLVMATAEMLSCRCVLDDFVRFLTRVATHPLIIEVMIVQGNF